MPVHLLFLFFLQCGLAFVFTYFIARILLKGNQETDSASTISAMRKVRNIITVITVIIPPAMFAAYYQSLPQDQSTAVAIWPSVWIFLILLALVLALTFAMVKHPDHPAGE